MPFPEGFLDEVRRTADIVRLISEHVTLKKAGASWKGLCPFHHEKTPSFNVRQDPAVFHCFGCGEGGDVFKFVMLHERVGFPEAVETVARRFGVPVPERRPEPGPDRKEREELFELLEAAAQHFARNLWTAPGTRAREYLLGRGFRRETLEAIRAGAAADSWSDLLDSLRRRFQPATLQTAGLVIEKQGGGGFYDRFRNRAIFPILNEAGKVVGFGARCLDGSDPKYINSPESPVYSKGRILYGHSWAREGIRQASRAVLVEGYLDLARLIEAGVNEGMATCGTALTPGHARLLRRLSERVVLNFDQDEAGQRAVRRSAEVLLGEGLRVQVVELPAGHDPDSYVKEAGAASYRQRLDEAPDLMEWLIRRAAAEHDTSTPPGKADYLEALLPTLARLESAVERAAWMTRIAESGGLDPQATREEVRRAVVAGRSKAAASSVPPASTQSMPRPALLPAERLLLGLALQGAAGIGEALNELDDGDLERLASADVLRAARELTSEGRPVTASALDEKVTAPEYRRLLTELAVEGAPAEGVTPADCVRELRCVPLKARMAEIQKQIGRATGPAQEALLQEKQQLSRRLASL